MPGFDPVLAGLRTSGAVGDGQNIAAGKVYGPYETINSVGPEASVFVSIPWSRVMGSQVLVSIKDNFASRPNVTVLPQFWAMCEVQLFGVVQGYETRLKTQAVRMDTGPCHIILPYEEAYDSFVVKGRNMSGGRRGPNPNAGIPASAANGYSIELTVHVMPRGGINPQMETR